MHFQIVHTTEYDYSASAVESYTELRVRPRNSLKQVVVSHATEVNPQVPLETFTDYYGNYVEAMSVPFRHRSLTVTSRSQVETRTLPDPFGGLDLSVSEAVRLCWPQRRELYDFLIPSQHVPITPAVEALAAKLLPSSAPFVESVIGLNAYLYKNFKYQSGVTDISTPIDQVIETRQGVCQDFAHVMLAVIRAAGLPARYVSGYIETDAAAKNSEKRNHRLATGALLPGFSEDTLDDEDTEEAQLIGATASHAWVEIYSPNHHWVGLDPTNNIREGERHVQIAVGRDYADVPPLRGVYKGAQQQFLSVKVSVRRSSGDPELTQALWAKDQGQGSMDDGHAEAGDRKTKAV
jgi:transglutaminase-like putative cysteine protease